MLAGAKALRTRVAGAGRQRPHNEVIHHRIPHQMFRPLMANGRARPWPAEISSPCPQHSFADLWTNRPGPILASPNTPATFVRHLLPLGKPDRRRKL